MRLHQGDICIRRVKRDDFQAIIALLRQWPGNLHRLMSETDFGQVFEILLEGRMQEAFVATLRHRVIGFVSMYYMKVLHHGGTVASLQELVVTEELRGRGVGRALVDFARTRAREMSCTGIELASGLPGLGKRILCGRVLRPAGLTVMR